MGKMVELIGIADAYENAINYLAVREGAMTVEDVLGLLPDSLYMEDRAEIISGWKSEFRFVDNEFRRFTEKNPEYYLVDEVSILAPNGEDCADCISATEFIDFCEKH